MSFGWSAGDILTGVRALWTVYECFGDGVRNAHKEFKSFQDEVQDFLDLLQASQMLVEGVVDLNPLFKRTVGDCEKFIDKHRLLAIKWGSLSKNGSQQKTDAFVKVYKTVMWPVERTEVERLQNQWLRHIVFGNFVASSHSLNITQQVDRKLGEVDQKADQISTLLQKVLQHFEHYTRLAIRPEIVENPLPALETLRSLEENPARNTSSLMLLQAPQEDQADNYNFADYLKALAERCENRATRDRVLVNVDRARTPDRSLLQIAAERQENVLKRGQKLNQSILDDNLPSFLGVSPVVAPNPRWRRSRQESISGGISRINTLGSDYDDDSLEKAIRRLSTTSFSTTGTAQTGSTNLGSYGGAETPLTSDTPDSMAKIAVFEDVTVSCIDMIYSCTVTLYRDTLHQADSYLESQTADGNVRILHHLPLKCYPWLYPAKMPKKKNHVHFRGKNRAARSAGVAQDYKTISPPEYSVKDSPILKRFQADLLQQRVHLNVDIASLTSKSKGRKVEESKLEVLRILEDDYTKSRSLLYWANAGYHQERSFELGIFDRKLVPSGDRVLTLNVTHCPEDGFSISIKRRSSILVPLASAVEDSLPPASELHSLQIRFSDEKGREDFVKMYGRAWVGSPAPSPQTSPGIGAGFFGVRSLSTSPQSPRRP